MKEMDNYNKKKIFIKYESAKRKWSKKQFYKKNNSDNKELTNDAYLLG